MLITLFNQVCPTEIKRSFFYKRHLSKNGRIQKDRETKNTQLQHIIKLKLLAIKYSFDKNNC